MNKIKTFFFKTCPKSGRIRGLRTDLIYHKLIFPIVGLVALVWVIVRVAPKPSRAEYPCQQAAIPVAFSFLAWISASALGIFLLRISRNFFNKKRIIFAGVLCLIGVSIFGVAQLFNSSDLSAATQSETDLSVFSTKPNQPIGTAKGIYPGRVTWVRDIAATPWDGKTGKCWEEGNINEQALTSMMSKSVRSLTGATNDTKAWTRLFQYYNRRHGKGNIGWKPGELVAVKININNTYQANDVDNDIDQSPQATRALLKQLTGPAGVAQKDIIIYDASVGWKVRAIPDRIYKPLHEEFPEVRWMDGQGSPGREKPEWVANATLTPRQK